MFGSTPVNSTPDPTMAELPFNETACPIKPASAGEAPSGKHVASANAIPTDLIERVDVLTGATSAVYGADGVSGVVNFVLKRNFDGVAARSQFGISDRGDAANRFASLIAGRNFADSKALCFAPPRQNRRASRLRAEVLFRERPKSCFLPADALS